MGRIAGRYAGRVAGQVAGRVAAGPWRRLHRTYAHWDERATQHARRNAMVASTTLLQRRREREEVEEFLAHDRARRVAATGHARQAVRTVEAGAAEILPVAAHG